MKKFSFPLTNKALLAFFIVLLPIFVVFLITYSRTRSHLERHVLEDMKAIADEREGYLLFFLESHRQLLAGFASDGEVEELFLKAVDGDKAGAVRLGEYLAGKKLPLAGGFDEIMVISDDGRVTASTSGAGAGKDVSRERFFIDGRKGVYVTGAEKGEPRVTITAPLRVKGREGSLAAHIPLSNLNMVFTGEHAKELGAISWNLSNRHKTLDTYLVNRERLMITESAFIKGAVLNQSADTLPVRSCMEKGTEEVGFYRDYRGVEVAGASMCLKSLGWTLLAEIDKDEALAPAIATGRYAVVTFAVTASLMAALIWSFIRVVVRQMNSLASASREMASGNYEVVLPVITGDEIGELTEGFNSMAREINERKRALVESKERLTNAQRIARVGDWDWDIAKGESYWSEEVFRIFGLPCGKTGLSHDEFLKRLHPGDREPVNRAIRDALTGMPYSMDFRVMLPDGSERVVHSEAEVTLNEKGMAVRMAGTNQDITERKRAEQEILRLNSELEGRVRERTAQLETSNRGLESFSYSVAHDLRAPLRTIDGFSKALIEDCSDRLDDKGVDYLKRVRDASQRMGKLIDDLLELSHITRTEMRCRRVDLSALALAIATELKKAEPGREMEFEISDGLQAHGDEGLLKVALENLIGNACKFTGRLPSSRIEFSKTVKDNRTVFFVRDNGAGFNMDYVGKLFTPFQRLHSTAEFPGTGIGLATVARIIERHGGRVWGEGAVGKGATFYFTL